jgi:hypothetical protein
MTGDAGHEERILKPNFARYLGLTVDDHHRSWNRYRVLRHCSTAGIGVPT